MDQSNEKSIESQFTFTVNLKVGDTAWFFADGTGKMTSGEVIGIVERYSTKVYVIEVPTHIDPIYYARDDLMVSDAEDKPIGMWRWVRHTVKNR